MRKFLLFTLVVFVSVIAVAWWLLSDANRYKPQLVELIQEHTGLMVAIRGDLKWRLWPPVQLVAQNVTADWAADASNPMLAARSLSLDADVWPLLAKHRKLVVQGIAIDGLRAKLIEHGETANWMPPGHAGPVVAPLPVPPPSADPSTPWEVASISLSDAVIDYVVDDKPTQILVDALEMKGIAPARRFPLHTKLTVKKGALDIPLTIAAELTFDEGATQWQLDNVDISGLYGNPGLPFQFKTNAQLDTKAGTGSLQNAHVDLGKVSATFDVTAIDLLTTPQYTGHLDLPQQPLDSVAGLFGTHLDVPVGVKAAFSATEKRVDLTETELRYGPSVVTGKIGTPIGGKLNIAFDLATDRFVVPSNRTAVATLGGGSFAVLAFAAPSVSVDPALDAPVLPLDLIRSTDWNGKIAIAQLEQDGATFHNATITSSNESGAVSGALDLPDFFRGTATTQLKIDATGSTPQWNITPKLNHVDSQAMLQWLHEKYDWVATFHGRRRIHHERQHETGADHVADRPHDVRRRSRRHQHHGNQKRGDGYREGRRWNRQNQRVAGSAEVSTVHRNLGREGNGSSARRRPRQPHAESEG